MSSQNKTRKRKWDLDDQGKEAPPSTNNPSPPTSKQPKLETANDATGSSAADSPTPSNSDSVDPNIAAAVAAAKINAMLAAKGIQVPVKPISIPLKSSLKSDVALNGTSEDSRLLTKESDSEFTKDIIINDCKNRYLLTKGATQQQIQKETNADVTTRGKYYPDKSLATEKDPPLFLHVTAPSQESLDAAIKKIEELMEQAFNPTPATQAVRQGNSQHPGGFVQTKVFVEMEPDRTFNARAKIVGPQGAFVKHIQQETGAKVQLKGKGSGYIEPTSGAEAYEPLHIHITCWSQEGLDKAKRLCEDLVNTVKVEWEKHKAQQAVYTYGRSLYPRPPGYGPPPPPGGGYPQPPVNPPLPSGPPPPISGSPPPLLPATSASTTSQPPLPLYPPPPPPLSQPPSASPSSTTQSITSNATSTASNTYDATSSIVYGSSATQALNAPYNPYNPYNQSRYYQQYPQYSNYYAQAQPGTTADPNSYYGFQNASSYATSGYTTASASASPPQTPSVPSPPASASLPTSGSHYDDKKFNQSSYHAVPPPDSYESEVGSKN